MFNVWCYYNQIANVLLRFYLAFEKPAAFIVKIIIIVNHGNIIYLHELIKEYNK